MNNNSFSLNDIEELLNAFSLHEEQNTYEDSPLEPIFRSFEELRWIEKINDTPYGNTMLITYKLTFTGLFILFLRRRKNLV